MKFRSLSGLVPYEMARQLQLELVQKRARDEIPDTVLFLEHEPVITRGRGLQFTGEARPKHMPIPQNLPSEIQFCETERGGDLTYHGPGQLVVYPIFKIEDIARFLRDLEQVFIDVLEDYGIEAHIRARATGVWVGDKKLVSIGIAVKSWVTYHGAAINCVGSLSPFQLISPCGFDPEVMTRMKDLVAGYSEKSWRRDLEARLARRWQPKRDYGNVGIAGISIPE